MSIIVEDYEAERRRVRNLLLQAAGELDIFPSNDRTEGEIVAIILIELARRVNE